MFQEVQERVTDRIGIGPGHCQIEVGVDDGQGSAAQDIPAVPVQAPLLLPPLL